MENAAGQQDKRGEVGLYMCGTAGFCGFEEDFLHHRERWTQALLVERFRQMLDHSQAPIHRFLDREKAVRFLSQRRGATGGKSPKSSPDMPDWPL